MSSPKLTSQRGRMMAFVLACVAGMQMFGLVATRELYAAPVFATVRSILDLRNWAIVWGIIGASALIAAATKRVVWWKIATTLSMFTGTVWLLGLAWAHWVNHYPISWSGLALWFYFVTYSAVAATGQVQYDPGTQFDRWGT